MSADDDHISKAVNIVTKCLDLEEGMVPLIANIAHLIRECHLGKLTKSSNEELPHYPSEIGRTSVFQNVGTYKCINCKSSATSDHFQRQDGSRNRKIYSDDHFNKNQLNYEDLSTFGNRSNLSKLHSELSCPHPLSGCLCLICQYALKGNPNVIHRLCMINEYPLLKTGQVISIVGSRIGTIIYIGHQKIDDIKDIWKIVMQCRQVGFTVELWPPDKGEAFISLDDVEYIIGKAKLPKEFSNDLDSKKSFKHPLQSCRSSRSQYKNSSFSNHRNVSFRGENDESLRIHRLPLPDISQDKSDDTSHCLTSHFNNSRINESMNKNRSCMPQITINSGGKRGQQVYKEMLVKDGGHEFNRNSFYVDDRKLIEYKNNFFFGKDNRYTYSQFNNIEAFNRGRFNSDMEDVQFNLNCQQDCRRNFLQLGDLPVPRYRSSSNKEKSNSYFREDFSDTDDSAVSLGESDDCFRLPISYISNNRHRRSLPNPRLDSNSPALQSENRFVFYRDSNSKYPIPESHRRISNEWKDACRFNFEDMDQSETCCIKPRANSGGCPNCAGSVKHPRKSWNY